MNNLFNTKDGFSLNKDTSHSTQFNVSRPKTLDEFEGQTHLKKKLNVYMQAAQLKREPLDHLLFSGPPGLGKTTLAQILASSMGTQFQQISAPNLNRPGDLIKILTTLASNDVLFIDEIHRLHISTEEVLYSAMEDFKVNIALTQTTTGSTVSLDIPPFTLIGATTRPGILSAPLRDRFGIHERVDFYTENELKKVLSRYIKIWNIQIEPDALDLIAQSSRKTPRISIQLLKRIFDFALVSQYQKDQTNIKNIQLDKENILYALQQLDIDSKGLSKIDRTFLEIIATQFNGGPVGLKPLAAILSEDVTTIEDFIEPFLIREQYLSRTPQGRVLTSKGLEHLNLSLNQETKK